MQRVRHHSAFAFLCLLVLVGLAAPSLHRLSHLVQEDRLLAHTTRQAANDASIKAATLSAAVLHDEVDCATCDLIATLVAVPFESSGEGITVRHTANPTVSDGIVVAAHPLTLGARAPPAARS